MAPFASISRMEAGERRRSTSGAGARVSGAPSWQPAQRFWNSISPFGACASANTACDPHCATTHSAANIVRPCIARFLLAMFAIRKINQTAWRTGRRHGYGLAGPQSIECIGQIPMMHGPLGLVIQAIIDRAVIHQFPALGVDDKNFGGAIHA